jgi:membrane-associated phospholipid phosphatase
MDRRTRDLLAMAAGCGALFAILVVAAYAWEGGRSLDLLGLTGFMTADHGTVEAATGRLARLGDPPQVALIALALAAVGVLRGRPRVAVVVLLLIAATSVSGQLLKALLAHPRAGPWFGPEVLGPKAFPSGHATAAMSLALAAVFVAPRRGRPAAALLGSLLALGVGASVVASGWHFPSDVLGGYLLATGWALALVALLREADRLHPARARWAATAVARLGERLAAGGFAAAAVGSALLALAAGAAVVAGDPSGTAAFARDHTVAVLVGAGVASAALALPLAIAALVRRS